MANHWQGKTLGFIGGGNMASAIIRGVLRSRLLLPDEIHVVEPDRERREELAKLGCRAGGEYAPVVQAGVVVIAVKPQVISQALQEAAKYCTGAGPKVVISIAAGVPLMKLAGFLPPGMAIIRAMPNLPLTVGRGMTALAPGSFATKHDMASALELFAASGQAIEVTEDKLDAVTAISGSGPAYFFKMVEALEQAGEDLGLESRQAMVLAVETIAGAAAMLDLEPEPGKLRERVTSPGGTTAAALDALARGGFDELVSAAAVAAAKRASELGR